MKLSPTASPKKGFSLLELMVAMAITTIIVTVLVSVTSLSLDAWNRSRAEIRASRQAKTMVETMARDFEALVARRGNTFEWLSAETSPPPQESSNIESSNAAKVYFFTGATDRYNGEINGPDQIQGNEDDPEGGDVSCVGYNLEYKDPIQGASGDFKTFVLNRKLVNPDVTFEKLLGQTDLAGEFLKVDAGNTNDNTNFVCENVYQFSLTFHVEVVKNSITHVVPLTISKTRVNTFKILGTGLVYTPPNPINGFTSAEISAGRITSVEVSLTVISDFGIEQLRKRSFSDEQKSEFFNKNSYQYSKRIEISSM